VDEGASNVSLDWDDHNVAHLARHRIQPNEVEEFFGNDPAIRSHEVVDSEDRWTAAGVTNAMRVLVVVFTVRGDMIRPITGWNADRRTKEEFFSERGA
jgi:uncharacterized DUF497 family protein